MFATPAHAAGAATQGGAAAGILQFLPLVLIFVAFYFLMIRPQSKRMKELQRAVAAVKKGDEVTTAGGIVGKVTRVEDLMVEIEIANGVKVKVVKSTLAGVAARGAKPAND